MKKIIIISLSLLVLITVGCTSSPNLESYPERHVDRPYTLPDDVATWRTTVNVNRVDDGSDYTGLSVYPLLWEQALNDKWTLEYSPLPLGVRYQIAKTNWNIWGVRAGTGIGYSSLSGTIFQPQISLYHRYKMASSYAWESTVLYSTVFRSNRDRDQWENTILSTGPMFQLSDNKVLLPKIGFGLFRNELAGFEDYENFTGDDDLSFYMPASLNFKWLFDRQWEYTIGYRVNSLFRERNRFAVHTVNSSIIHYW